MQREDLFRSLRWFLAGIVPAYALLWVSGGRASVALSELASHMFWAVPFVLAASLAMFNNMLRLFDRMESVIKEDGRLFHADSLHEAVSTTSYLTSALLLNAFIAIVAGLLFFLIRSLERIPAPAIIEPIRPYWFAVSAEAGLGLLAVVILIKQFAAIPKLVDFYRFFAVDRHMNNLEQSGNDDDSSDQISRMGGVRDQADCSERRQGV